MQTLRIAAVSMNSLLGQSEKTLATMSNYCQEAADAGVSHFLVKPFSTRQVQVALTTVLTQQRSDELSDILD